MTFINSVGKQKQWYFENGILPLEEGGGPNGTLIVTVDSPESGISVPEIESIIKKCSNGIH